MSKPRLSLVAALACALLVSLAVATPPAEVWVGTMYASRVADRFHKIFNFAVDHINNSPDILPDTALRLRHLDTGAESYTVSKNIVSLLQGTPGPNEDPTAVFSTPVAVLGGVHSGPTVTIASTCSAFQVPNVGIITEFPEFSDTSRYPFFMRTYPHALYNARASARLMVDQGWDNAILLYIDSPVGTGFADAVQDELASKRGDAATLHEVTFRTHAPGDLDVRAPTSELSQQFIDSMERAVDEVMNSRVKIVIVYTVYGRTTLWKTLSDRGVLAAKQVITNDIFAFPLQSAAFVESLDTVQGLMVLSKPPISPSWPLLQEYEQAEPDDTPIYIHPPALSAAMLVAQALHSLLYTQNQTLEEIHGQPLLQEMLATPLEPAWSTNHENKLDDQGDRPIDIVLYNYHNDQGQRREAGVWRLHNDVMEWSDTPLVYFGGKTNTPTDTIEIYYVGCEEKSTSALVGLSIGLGVLCVALAVTVVWVKKKSAVVAFG